MSRDAKLVVPERVWSALLAGLHRRTEGEHESGAFLLGRVADGGCRRVERVIYYDELDHDAYRTGVVVLHSASFGPLWALCRETGLLVIADIHVHERGAGQSLADRENPMIALPGHLALIVPWFAKSPVFPESLGFYEYRGSHQWRDLGGRQIARWLRIER